ncbi:MAG: ABC transporter permease [Eubacteriales bacterium]|nr:ABC transporter permease [Eubacteriales bacterium]
MKKFFKRREASILVLLLVLMVVFSFSSDQFLTLTNFKDCLKSSSLKIILAAGMSIVLITGGIDMSLVATAGMTQMIFGRLMAYAGWGPVPTILVTVLLGILFGSVNGLLISKGRIAPIVATLGVASVVKGMMYVYMDLSGSSSLWINSNELPGWFLSFGTIKVMGIPIQIIIAALIVLLTYWMMHFTIIGRCVYAIGGNKNAAERIGINVDLITIFVYAYFGFILSIGVFADTAGIALCDPNSYNGIDFEVVAAVVVGGVTMVGGFGSIIGGVLGALFMVFLSNGLGLIRVSTYWQKVIVGIVIIIAVSVEAAKRLYNERHAQTIDVM